MLAFSVVIRVEKKREHSHADHPSRDVLVVLVLLVGHYLPHDHVGDHFRCLRQNLHEERHVLKSFVLAPRAQDVGQRAVRVFVERGRVLRLFGAEQVRSGQEEGEDAVDEDEELGVFEAGRPVPVHVLLGHDHLLEVAPREVGALEAEEAEEKDARGLGR